MTKVTKKAYTEVDEILKYLPDEYVEKVPLKYRRMMHDCKDGSYKVNIDPNKSIDEQKILYETRVILAYFRYYYWCKSEEDKKQMDEILKQNEEKIKDRYDFSKLNERPQDANKLSVAQEKEKANNLPMVVEKKSWFSKFILKIKNIFKK